MYREEQDSLFSCVVGCICARFVCSHTSQIVSKLETKMAGTKVNKVSHTSETIYGLSESENTWQKQRQLINPRRACAVRVTVLGLCVCVCVCVCVCLLLNISLFTRLFVPQTILTLAADEGRTF